MPQRSLSRPSSRHELALDDEELLGDSATGLATPHSSTQPQDPTLTLEGLTEPLPPLNLASAVAYSSARAKVIPQAPQSHLQHPPQLQHQPSSSFSVQQRPHKSSFSVPPSSRAVNTFSVVDSSEDADALHARTANYETLLRQFTLRRQGNLRSHTYQAPVATSSSVASRSSRLQRAGSTEDLRNTLTRLSSTLSLDRIRRRSNEGSSIATSAVHDVDVSTSSSIRAPSPQRRRVSLARSVRRLKLRVAFQLRSLLEPLSPQSPTSLLRHVAVVLLLLLQLVYLPFAPTFLAEFHVGLMIQVNVALELLWLLDLGLQFNTAIIVDDNKTPGGRLLVMTRSLIAQAYLQRAFLLDALAALPLETVASLTRAPSTALVQSHPTLYYVGSCLRLLKFRLVPTSLQALARSPLGQWITRVQYRQGYVSVVTVSVEILFVLIIGVHYLACAWYVVMPSGSITVFPGDLLATYVHALVDVSLLFTGDGIIAIHTMEADATISVHVRLFLLFMMLLGVVLSAFAFARLSVVLLLDTLVQQEREGTYHLERSLASLTARMTKMRLPDALQDRVKQYFTHLSREYGVVDGRDSSLFHFSQSSDGHSRMLSAPLALEVALCRYTATLGRMGLWKGCSADLMSALIVRVEPRVYLKDDFVRRKGEISTELVIVQRGTCEYMAPHSQGHHDDRRSGTSGRSSPLKSSSQQRLLTVGASLGQLALIVDYKFPVYVRAVNHIEVGIVKREVFQELVNRFVDDRERLVRRIFRTGLESAELPALWHLVNRYYTPPAGGATTTAATASFASTTTASSGVVTVATRTATPLVRQGTTPATSERRITTREAAKTLVRVLEVSTMPSHVRLSLPLVLEPEVVRNGGLRPGSHRTLSVSTRSGTAPLHRTQSSDPSAVNQAAAAVSAVSAAATAASAPSTSAPATALPTPNEEEAPKTPEFSARAESQAFLDELAQTQSALLNLVQNLSEAVTRLDLKVSRMEEHVNRNEDTPGRVPTSNSHYALLRRRSSRMDSEDHVLIRRRSSFNGSDGYDRERDNSSYDWHVPRMLPPDELAVLRANAAAAALGHKVNDSESRPASSAFTDRQTRLQSSRASSHVSEMPQSTFDEEALTLRGVHMLGQLTSRSTPPSSTRLGSSQIIQSAGSRLRSKSLSTTTRQRLNSFQASLQQAITGAATAENSMDSKRRASLSTMWTRAKPTSGNGGGGLS